MLAQHAKRVLQRIGVCAESTTTNGMPGAAKSRAGRWVRQVRAGGFALRQRQITAEQHRQPASTLSTLNDPISGV
jgi:hypothetical protein